MTERDARGRIRLAAERLIAERGADVPLREIAVAAAQRNNSAVQYHFGSREALIAAIVEHRELAITERRLELLAEREASSGADEIASLVEMLVLPLLEVPYRQGATHYARFLEQVRHTPAVAGGPQPAAAQSPVVQLLLDRLERALPELPAALRQLRLTALGSVMFALIADRERAVEQGSATGVDLELSAAHVVDVLVALLTVAPSPAALQAAAKGRLARV